MIKAIETAYNGCRFRSRNEARWAIFFDALGIQYQYEKEGYDFDGIRYLPDFWLPDYGCWIEMKGAEPTEDELRKTHLLALYGEKKVYTFFGDIWFPSQQKYGGAYLNDGTHWSQGYYWYECLRCGELGIASSDEHGRFPCSCTETAGEHTRYKNDTPRLFAAYTTGRKARFEFGDRGTPRREGKQKTTNTLPSPERAIPLLPAYIKARRRGSNHAYVWCEHCNRWNFHSVELENLPIARPCHHFSCPYQETGYRFFCAATFTLEIERMHGKIPTDVPPLTEQQLRCWSALYQEPRIYRKVGRRTYAASLLSLFELNAQAENIKGTHLLERQTYLSWMLHLTPQAHLLKRRGWQFCLRDEYLQHLPINESHSVRFPEEIDQVNYWLEDCMEEGPSPLSVWSAYSSYRTWANQKGYQPFSKADWEYDMQTLGYTALLQTFPSMGEQHVYRRVQLKQSPFERKAQAINI